MSVASILSGKDGDVLTVTPDQTIDAASKILAERKVGAVIVVSPARKVAGILSERDIVRGLAAHGADVLKQPVSRLMTEAVTVCDRAESIDNVMRKMTDGRFRHMPVVEDGELVGVVSIGDVVKHKIANLQHEAEALRDYVMS
ncbi:CBS domain-containing protein [Marivibrio halodurans]|uniref:CBS domain-containing protein n=1 Tax=Marivibrio halodurans TaxID=2039722 RepID=A0A8J7SMB9_9PROT|nr:CBS domain-containing protein [Marivibrio halodurans]MBP5856836.1 CBS domain-containing protein [Marivibrio halodurans]